MFSHTPTLSPSLCRSPANSPKESGRDGHFWDATSFPGSFCAVCWAKEGKTTLIFGLLTLNILSFLHVPWASRCSSGTSHHRARHLLKILADIPIYVHTNHAFRVFAKSGHPRGFILEMKENDTTMTERTKANCGDDLTNTAWAMFCLVIFA